MKRSFGLLMPIFSIDNGYGIGDFGSGAYKFVDFALSSGAKVWQVLPLVQTGVGNSPYSSISANSINPLFISPERLLEKGLIKKCELNKCKSKDKRVDYAKVYSTRFDLLKKAFVRFDKQNQDFIKFKNKKQIKDYSLFMAIKGENNDKPFYEWEDSLKFRNSKALKQFEKNNQNQIDFWAFTQFLACEQWQRLKDYANKKGLKIMGDMPLYVALDSVDVWTNPRVFKLDENLKPKKVAGVPPDYFCAEGQLWGNPVYDYEYLKTTNFTWWVDRLKRITSMFDYIRIDHFRGLDRCFEIEADAQNAMVGEWIDVPSIELFNAIFRSVKKEKIIAEDLGIIDDGVRELLKFTGCPGMKILSFAFNGDENNLYLPKNIEENYVCYTGTHDNDTLVGLINNFSDWDKNNAYKGVKQSLKEVGLKGKVKDNISLAKAIISLGFSCKANLFVLPVQDAVLLDGEYRINTPGLVDDKNWSIILDKKYLSKKNSELLKNNCKKFGR